MIKIRPDLLSPAEFESFESHMSQTLEAKVAAATTACVARDPAASLTESTGLPLVLTNSILTRYVSIFSGTRDLMDEDDNDDAPGDFAFLVIYERVVSWAAYSMRDAGVMDAVSPVARYLETLSDGVLSRLCLHTKNGNNRGVKSAIQDAAAFAKTTKNGQVDEAAPR